MSVGTWPSSTSAPVQPTGLVEPMARSNRCWDGVNIPIPNHNDSRSPNQINAIHDSMDDIMVSRDDPGALLVGEWGVTQQEQRAPDPACPGVGPVHANPISAVFNLIKPWASIMFFFKHGNAQDPEWDPCSVWGIHEYSEIAGAPGQYILGAATNLHGPLDTLVGP